MRGVEGAESQPMSAAVHRSPNKLWISNSIFDLWSKRLALVFFSIVEPDPTLKLSN
jgi:hypothetical protein